MVVGSFFLNVFFWVLGFLLFSHIHATSGGIKLLKKMNECTLLLLTKKVFLMCLLCLFANPMAQSEPFSNPYENPPKSLYTTSLTLHTFEFEQ